MNGIHFHHWRPADKKALSLARTDDLEELKEVALTVIDRIHGNFEMACGPITTGGVGNAEGNLRILGKTIEHLQEKESRVMFSQIPFEAKLFEFHRRWSKSYPTANYCWPILLNFYRPIFGCGRLVTANFIHGWRRSVGARWEHKECRINGIRRRYLSKDLVGDFIVALSNGH